MRIHKEFNSLFPLVLIYLAKPIPSNSQYFVALLLHKIYSKKVVTYKTNRIHPQIYCLFVLFLCTPNLSAQNCSVTVADLVDTALVTGKYDWMPEKVKGDPRAEDFFSRLPLMPGFIDIAFSTKVDDEFHFLVKIGERTRLLTLEQLVEQIKRIKGNTQGIRFFACHLATHRFDDKTLVAQKLADSLGILILASKGTVLEWLRHSSVHFVLFEPKAPK